MNSPVLGSGRRPALDGIRAVAVLAVMGFHLDPRLASGFLGVDAFFVLSGFLISTLLIEEWTRRGTIALRLFYLRRALRLLPALAIVLAVTLVYTLRFVPDTAVSSTGASVRDTTLYGIGAAALYVANWARITTGTLGIVDHTWSLGVEEQFYLLWPLVLLLMLGRRWSRQRIAIVLIGMALMAAAWRAGLWLTGSSISRVFSGLDTRADELLVGAALAVVGTSGWLPKSRWFAPLAQATALVAGVALTWIAIRYGPSGGFFFVFGFPMASIAVMLLIASFLVPAGGPLRKLLEMRPVVWIGQISYGLYLWHFPIILMLYPLTLNWSHSVSVAVDVVVTFLVATLSFYALERPILRLKDRFHPETPQLGTVPLDAYGPRELQPSPTQAVLAP